MILLGYNTYIDATEDLDVMKTQLMRRMPQTPFYKMAVDNIIEEEDEFNSDNETDNVLEEREINQIF